MKNCEEVPDMDITNEDVPEINIVPREPVTERDYSIVINNNTELDKDNLPSELDEDHLPGDTPPKIENEDDPENQP